MPGQINFQYRCVHDVVIAHVNWRIETLEDLELWQAQYHEYFQGRFPHKVDLILELTKFRLNPRLATRFRELRNEILDAYTTRSYRVKEPTMERAMMYAGSVLNGGPANHFDTLEAAIEALLEDRKNGDGSNPSSLSRLAISEAPEAPSPRPLSSRPPP
jgi:hypothetical protein